MSPTSRRTVLAILVLLALAALAVFLTRCRGTPATPVSATSAAAPASAGPAAPAVSVTPPPPDAETPATLNAPESAVLGSSVQVTWTGPNNPRDYITIVPKGTLDGRYERYTETKHGSPLTLVVPVEVGEAELRYMTQAGKVLGRRPLTVLQPEVTLDAPAEAVAGTDFQVTWKGPANPKDYITIVPGGTPDGQYRNYTDTAKGSPLSVRALIEPGVAEIRYMTAEGSKVLARRELKLVAAKVTLDGPAEAMAGSSVPVGWTGPNNEGDYVTIVTKATADGQYAKYADTKNGPKLTIEVPIEAGDAEIRYMSGQGAKVLARRDLKVVAARVTVDAPERVTAGAVFKVVWTGPNNPGDYVTVVPRGLPDGQYRNHKDTKYGSPLELTSLIEPGDAEVRYVTGTESRVLARRPLTIVAAEIALNAPAEVTAGSPVTIAWRGPNNAGDYLTIVRQGTPDGQYARYVNTSKGPSVVVDAPIDPGPAEIRYMSGQGEKVLARRDLTLTAPKIALKPPARGAAGAIVAVTWSGPANPGDYLTIVNRSARDGATLHTVPATRGSPASLRMPKEVGPAEIRYMSGQGDRVLARADIESVSE